MLPVLFLVSFWSTQQSKHRHTRICYFVCRRLLSTDPEAAKEVVLAEKPVIADTSSNLEPALLDILLANLSTLSSVYHKPPEVSSCPDSVAQVYIDLPFSDLKLQTKLQPEPRQFC